jgi:hypothetical protein
VGGGVFRSSLDVMPNEYRTLYQLQARVLVHADTREIRLTSDGTPIETFRRTLPHVEARVLSDKPLRIAVRIRNPVSSTVVALEEISTGAVDDMLFVPRYIRSQGDGDAPCWLVIPDQNGLRRDQGLPVRLSLLDPFHHFVFDYAR